MRDVYDFAKFFIKNGADSSPNTYDGNMKLQKLLVFADLANIAEYGEPLFGDQVLAFKNGCVVEKVRLRYKNDYVAFYNDSKSYQPDFSEREYEILRLILDIFGNATAKELSEINHTFSFWKSAFIKETSSEVESSETINGVTFFFDGFVLTDDLMDQLEQFSLSAEEDAYSVYMDNGKLVIY